MIKNNSSSSHQHYNELLKKDSYSLHKLHIIDKYLLITFSDLEGNITDATQAFLDFTGYTREEIIGKNHSIFKHSDVPKDYVKKMWAVLNADKIFKGELKNINKAGHYFWIKITIEPIFDENNTKIGYLAIREDISSKKSLEEISTIDSLTGLYNRRYFNELFRKLFLKSKQKQTSLGLVIIDVDFFKLYNENYSHQAGDLVLAQIATVIRELASDTSFDIFRLAGEEFALLSLGYSTQELQTLCNTIKKRVEDLHITHEESKISDWITVSIGAVNLESTISYSINDIYNAADQNLYLAKKKGRNLVQITSNIDRISLENEIDEVTHLPTRVKLTQDLEKLQTDAMMILLYINDFSSFAEHYGSDFVQKMLIKKAKELRHSLLDNSSTLYRLNINEFAILVTDKNHFNRYLSLLKYSILPNSVCEVKGYKEDNIVVSYSAGISYGVHQILRKANIALHEAFKSMSSYAIYEEDENITIHHRNRLKNLCIYQEALENDNIIPYFQPLVDAKTNKVVKYEALARIRTRDGSIISPNLFLDVAKEDKTFEYFTRQLFQKIFHIYSKNDIKFSLNVTYENIVSSEFISYLENRLQKYGGERITFEIIESEEILDYKAVGEFITFIKKYGCKIAIDDFGSGYSNFTNLVKLDIDYIKIDGTIIEKLHSDKSVEIMAKSLISFAKATGIGTIAEFVSSEEIMYKVKQLGVDLLQGYYYGEPRPPQDYDLFL
ncbi:MAG: EAL domain-containing protein [Sulfurimonas sp.]|jgi:diguanylate cyclase (GGDEF)-like protein/PAS domain S-box-containing protein|nr:EAL domain-containing protein [Sulfurimonas sp.]